MLKSLRIQVVWGVILAMMLCIADATFTIVHIKFMGGTEWNPVMAHLLEDPLIFAWVKMIATGLGLVVLASCYEQGRWIRWSFWTVVGLYMALTIYHFVYASLYWN